MSKIPEEVRIVHSKRKAPTEAIAILYGSNSDCDMDDLDDADLDFIDQDNTLGIDETIIGIYLYIHLILSKYYKYFYLDAQDEAGDTGDTDQSTSSLKWSTTKKTLIDIERSPDFVSGEQAMCANNLQEQSPFYVFKHVSNFDSLIDDIIVPQTLLYAQQNGKDFQISKEEVMAFLGIQVVMGFLCAPIH